MAESTPGPATDHKAEHSIAQDGVENFEAEAGEIAPFRWLPSPTLSLALLLIWLWLNNSVSAGHIVLGSLIGFAIPLITQTLTTPKPKIQRWGLMFRYIWRMLWDIVICNIEVARQICGPMRNLNPAFISVPLDTRDELVITLLASTISLTPGTVSVDVSIDRAWLFVHVLHLEDEALAIEEIKTRYEAPLREIFGC